MKSRWSASPSCACCGSRSRFRFPDSPRYGGCRSWVELPLLPEGTVLHEVLDEATHRQREEELRTLLGVESIAPTFLSAP